MPAHSHAGATGAHLRAASDGRLRTAASDGSVPAGVRDLLRLLREVGTPSDVCEVVGLVARCCGDSRNGEAIRLTADVENVDDASALLLAYRATALAHVGMLQAARSTFTQALRSRQRQVEIRHFTLRQRADVYVSEGRRAQALRDLERIVAEGAAVDGVHERLRELRVH